MGAGGARTRDRDGRETCVGPRHNGLRATPVNSFAECHIVFLCGVPRSFRLMGRRTLDTAVRVCNITACTSRQSVVQDALDRVMNKNIRTERGASRIIIGPRLEIFQADWRPRVPRKSATLIRPERSRVSFAEFQPLLPEIEKSRSDSNFLANYGYR